LSTRHIWEWPPLLDGILHVQRVRGGTIEDAWHELQPALREGKVKARLAGARYHTFRHDGIDPSAWHRAAVIADLGGAVIFNFDGRTIITNPAHPNYLPLYGAEICWADVLRYWPEPKAPATKRPKPTAAELDTWMRQHVTRGAKRLDAIQACRNETGATFRDAAAAHKRLPEDMKLSRGQRTRPRKIEQ
jgi:hypothetical protein